MLLIKQTNKSSTKRTAVYYYFFHKYVFTGNFQVNWRKRNKRLIQGKVGESYKKFKEKIEVRNINNTLRLKTIHIVNNFGNYLTKPKEFTIVKNLYNQYSLVPSTLSMHPGFRLYPLRYLETISNLKNLVGQIVPLKWVPINMFISFVFNNSNNKASYIKSSGAKGIRKKLNRKDKLVNILLPSGIIKIFSTHTFSIFSLTLNLAVDRLGGGGWGYFPYNTKKLVVRGVAKNPVDHPNGGRTKAKQPELSPWGWIAKQSK